MSIDELWTAFNDRLLVPLIRELGAKTYELIRGKSFDLEPSPHLSAFLDTFSEDDRPSIRAAVVRFLDPTSTEIRAYVLRRLVAFFFIEATAIPEVTLDLIEKYAQGKPTFRLFIDTNLLFSFLELHDNPANEAATALRALREELADRVDMEFLVVPDTLAEAKHALGRSEEFLSSVYLTKNLAAATSGVILSGLAQKFLSESRKPGGPTRAKAYFEPIINNLLQLARARGIELYNEDTSALHVDQAVVDDILSHLAFQKKTRGDRAKTYEQVQHDVTMWHLTRRKRSNWVESPLAAEYWIVTVDYGLLGFDSHKAGRLNSLPVCIHPTGLLQLLQFWVPRTAVFEQALISNIRLPFLFLDFDVDAERATVAILETVNRFENFESLSSETVAAMLMNQGLRRRITAAKTDEERIRVVRLELVEHDAVLRRQLEVLEQQLGAKLEADDSKTDELAGLHASITELESKLLDTQSSLEASRSILERDHRRRSALNSMAVGVALSVILVCLVAVGLLWMTDLGPWRVLPGAIVLSVVLPCESALRIARSNSDLFTGKLWTSSARVRAVTLALIGGVIVNAAWDAIKALASR